MVCFAPNQTPTTLRGRVRRLAVSFAAAPLQPASPRQPGQPGRPGLIGHAREPDPNHRAATPTPTPPPTPSHNSHPTHAARAPHASHRSPQPPHAPEPPVPPHRVPATPHIPGDQRLTLLLSWADWRPSSWVDVLPAMLEPLGVTSVRTCSARQAERVIRTTQIHVAVVDLSIPLDAPPPRAAMPSGLPSGPHAAAHSDHAHDAAGDNGGGRVLELLRRLDSPPPTVILKAPHFARDEARSMRAALACDAFAVVDRAAADAELMLHVLQRCLERFYRGRWPGSAPGSGPGPGPNTSPGGRC